ncbi:hypothetical protein C7M84_023297, partial [Penaeus vannamei]
MPVFLAAEDCSIPPDSSKLVGTGIAVSLPSMSCYMQLQSPPLSPCYSDINVQAGVIDADYRGEVKTFIPERRDEFAVLTFPDHEKTLWTDEELLDFRIEPDSVDLVYYTLGKRGTCDLCLLLRMQYKSRPLYAEILYFDNAADANVERAALQSSIVLTYSVQDFIDSVVSCYEYREEYILDSDRWSEEWEVEDRDFIFENMLVHHAISPMLGQLYRGIVSSHREALWGDSKRAVMPALIGRQLSIHEKELWTDEELHNFRVEPDSVDVVYYTLGKRGTCDLCLLLQMQYKSKPLYAEILYFDNAANANVERAAHQSSIALTYSVQDFIDSVVACYEQREVYTPTCSVQSYINTLSSNEHREAYYYDWGEEWKVEDRDFIFENMLVYHAINNDNTKLRRSWSDNCSALNCLCHQSSQLGLLCRGILSGRREALWGDSQRAVLP